MDDKKSPDLNADTFSVEALEFCEVIKLFHRFLSGPISEPLLESLKPGADEENIRREFDRAREVGEYLRTSPRLTFGALKDPRPILEKLRIEGVTCSGVEILAIVAVARAAQDAKSLLVKSSFVRLAELVDPVADFCSLFAEVEGKIHSDGSLDDSASAELGRLRRGIENLRRELHATLEKLLRKLSQRQVLQDTVITVRNERLVIPVRSEEKRRVPGVIHGTSSSGATVYLEPLETVPLNNELVELEDREFAETQRILGVFTEKLRSHRGGLEQAASILGELDLAFAKAEFAHAFDACLPEFSEARSLVLRKVRHPVLEETLRKAGGKPVPITVALDAPRAMMIISGPNTGGKTVALKAIGVAVLMAQSGLPVLASEARLPVFGRVLADIGDQQSIQASLSTFSAHITNIERMVEVADANDLVLLDELGSSTDPSEGAALALALLDEFRQRGLMIFVTTHLSRLKSYATDAAEAVNAAMEFDEATLQPTYRLLPGLPGKSSALEIAARLGLRGTILARARELLGPAEADTAKLLQFLHERSLELDGQLAELEGQRQGLTVRAAELEKRFEVERRAKLKELDERLEATLRDLGHRWEKTLTEFRAEAEARGTGRRMDRKTAGLRQEARDEWNAQVLETLGAPPAVEEGTADVIAEVGDQVRVPNFSVPGTVTAVVDPDHLEVEIGRLRVRVRKGELAVISKARARTAVPVIAGRVRSEGHPSSLPLEINVIGKTAEEARDRVDEFLDQAYVAGRFRLRVIHGHGKGILRKTLHEMFASHPHVEKFYPAPPSEGGAGATVVELKL